jgi:hypothetical protein
MSDFFLPLIIKFHLISPASQIISSYPVMELHLVLALIPEKISGFSESFPRVSSIGPGPVTNLPNILLLRHPLVSAGV